MRQRLALARAMALEVDIMLMDEPLSALDALTREELQRALLDLWRRQGYAQVLVTHSIEEAVYLGRRIFLMTPRPGRISCVIDNPAMGTDGYRQTAQFYEQCARLRTLLSQENGRATSEATAVRGMRSDA
jgi:NitT/TauT family transport system ATP-binding protein